MDTTHVIQQLIPAQPGSFAVFVERDGTRVEEVICPPIVAWALCDAEEHSPATRRLQQAGQRVVPLVQGSDGLIIPAPTWSSLEGTVVAGFYAGKDRSGFYPGLGDVRATTAVIEREMAKILRTNPEGAAPEA